MIKKDLNISVTVRADRSMSGTGSVIPREMVTPDRQIDAVAYLPPIYHPYIKPILLREVENGVSVESSYGNAILDCEKNDRYEVKEIGLSYASCSLDLTYS